MSRKAESQNDLCPKQQPLPPSITRVSSSDSQDSGYSSGRVSSSVLQETLPAQTVEERTSTESIALAINTDLPAHPAMVCAAADSSLCPVSQHPSPLTVIGTIYDYGTIPISTTNIFQTPDCNLVDGADATICAEPQSRPTVSTSVAALIDHALPTSPMAPDRTESRPVGDWRLSQELVSAAEALEGQALSLRIMASGQQDDLFNEALNHHDVRDGSTKFTDVDAQDLLRTHSPIIPDGLSLDLTQPDATYRRTRSRRASLADDFHCYWSFIDELSSSQSRQLNQIATSTPAASTFRGKRRRQNGHFEAQRTRSVGSRSVLHDKHAPPVCGFPPD